MSLMNDLMGDADEYGIVALQQSCTTLIDMGTIDAVGVIGRGGRRCGGGDPLARGRPA